MLLLGDERFFVAMERSEAVVSRSLLNKHTCKLRLVDDLTWAARMMKVLVMVMGGGNDVNGVDSEGRNHDEVASEEMKPDRRGGGGGGFT